ncbi:MULTISPECIES: hypothetical protein [unclassified Tolypothrix]|nr:MULTISPECIES: hypothetical protein [unclassified Tolypothrix]BAY89507.1 hypothetical protein NIES3275_15100 [Microchaete diplosiphon NIES-3275]EKF02467.1 hypothetical protein FDUTEX481_06630 [Tolypothrix sp. PCC 7601]MBE9081537.1 hypothetical protein [Tolypothrix sp. LEGE 11397]UYD23792.1 hypothetical protein HGR01_19985 [Tolypothrix sp. PCC 7712]UYD33983.1 hypothetical protein HG267_34770 [Tolypothrix sp. PCC 7601]
MKFLRHQSYLEQAKAEGLGILVVLQDTESSFLSFFSQMTQKVELK